MTNIEFCTYGNHYSMMIINLVSCSSPFGLYLIHIVASNSDKNSSSIEITIQLHSDKHSQTGIRFVLRGYGVGAFSLSSSCFRGNKGLFGTSLASSDSRGKGPWQASLFLYTWTMLHLMVIVLTNHLLMTAIILKCLQ